MIEVNTLYLKVASRFVCNEEVRYYINGVHIEPHAKGGALLVATDGARLFCIYDDKAICKKSAIVRVPRNLAKAKDCSSTTTVGDDGILRHVAFQSNESCLIEGEFPDWRRILIGTAFAQKASPALSGWRIASFARAAEQLHGNNYASVRVIAGDDDCHPVLIHFPDSPNAFGVLMPTRASPAPPVFDWFIKSRPLKRALALTAQSKKAA